MTDIILVPRIPGELVLRPIGAQGLLIRRRGGAHGKGKGASSSSPVGVSGVVRRDPDWKAPVPVGDPMMRAVLTGFLPPVETPAYLRQVRREVGKLPPAPAVPELPKPPAPPLVPEITIEARVKAIKRAETARKNLKKARKARKR